jgi:hypothetical protein
VNNETQSARIHRVLGCITVAHSVCIFIAFYQIESVPSLAIRNLWVGFASLWIFWPIVLVAHPGRSLVRVAVPILASLPSVLASTYPYLMYAQATFWPVRIE